MTLNYTPNPENVLVVSQAFVLTEAEKKLIMRLRQSRRKGERINFIIDPLRMTLQPIDTAEIEELSRG